MIYTEEEIIKAKAITDSLRSQNSLCSEMPKKQPNNFTSQLIERLRKELYELPFQDHIDFFYEFKKITKERLMTETKKLENQYMETKDKVDQLDEFIKINLS